MDIQDTGHRPHSVDHSDFMAEPYLAHDFRGRRLSSESEAVYKYRESSYDRKARITRNKDKALDGASQQLIYSHALQPGQYRLDVIQQPGYGLAYGGRNKAIRGKLTKRQQQQPKPRVVRSVAKYPLYPLPVIQLKTSDGKNHNVLNCNPNFIAYATLRPSHENHRQDLDEDEQVGLRTCSLNRMVVPAGHPDPQQSVFAFADIHVRKAGRYYLQFDMFELVIDEDTGYSHAVHRCSVDSDAFTVYSKKAELPMTQPISALTVWLHESGFKTNPRRMPMTRKKENQDFSSNIAQEKKSARPPKPARPNKKEAPAARDTNTLVMTHEPQGMDSGNISGTIVYTNSSSTDYFDQAGSMNLPMPQGLGMSQSVMPPQPQSYSSMQDVSGFQHGVMSDHYQNGAQSYSSALGMTMTNTQAAAMLNIPAQPHQGQIDIAALAQGSAQEAMNWTHTQGQGYRRNFQAGEVVTNEFSGHVWHSAQGSAYPGDEFEAPRPQHRHAAQFGYFDNTQ